MNTGRQLKNRYRKSGSKLSLKAFAKKLLAEGDEIAMTWFYNKTTALEKIAKTARFKNKGIKIMQEKVSSRDARRRNKQQGKSTTTLQTINSSYTKK